MSDEELKQTLARAQQAIRIIRDTLQLYMEPFSEQERDLIRRLLALPGPRALPVPGIDSDVGRLYKQVLLLRAQLDGVEELAPVHEPMAELQVDVYATLLAQVSKRHAMPLSLQQALALLMAN